MRNFCHYESRRRRDEAVSIIVLIFIFLLLFFSTPKHLLFYDALEYLRIVSENSFIKSISMGHPPIHPAFTGLFWIVLLPIHRWIGNWEYAANLSAFVFGGISILLFYILAKNLLDKKLSILATAIFSLFPGIWIVNSNLMVESVLLTLFLFSSLLFIRLLKKSSKSNYFYFGFSVFILIIAHIQAVFWLPSVFALYFLFKDRFVKIKGKMLGKMALFTFASAAFSVLFYYAMVISSRKEILKLADDFLFSRATELYSFSGMMTVLARFFRNIFLLIARGFGSITPVLILYIYYKRKAEINITIALALFLISVFASGAIWSGDFMVRHVVFAGVIFSLLLVGYFQKRSVFIILYLIPIIAANIFLYNRFRSDTPLVLMKEMERGLPADGVLVQTHYMQPFTNYNGEVVWVGVDSPLKIDEYLTQGKRVFLDSQAVFAPYMLYVGSNLHITSLGKFGVSETNELFKKYAMDFVAVGDAEKRIFIYEIKPGNVSKTNSLPTVIASEPALPRGRSDERGNLTLEEIAEFIPSLSRDSFGPRNDDIKTITGKAKPGTPVLVYSNKLLKRIHRERIDYGDVGTWLWVLATNRREPLVWSYADSGGFFVLPVANEDFGDIYLKGENVSFVSMY